MVCSSSSNSVFDGKLAYVPALEDVLVWDVKKGKMVRISVITGLKHLILYSLPCGTRLGIVPRLPVFRNPPSPVFLLLVMLMVPSDSGILRPSPP